MSLPVTDNRTRAAGDRVSRADVLSIQDAQIAGYARGLRQQGSRRISAVSGRSLTAWGAIVLAPTPGVGGYYREASAGGGAVLFDLGLPVGRRVRSIDLRCYRGAGNPIVLALYRADRLRTAPDMVATISGGTVTTWATITATPSAIETVRPGFRYYLKVTSGNSGDRLSWLRVHSDRP